MIILRIWGGRVLWYRGLVEKPRTRYMFGDTLPLSLDRCPSKSCRKQVQEIYKKVN